ncbi:MAG: OmpA family protein [Candidatus Cyclobacteriaceae bacterium M2_1C_046]
MESPIKNRVVSLLTTIVLLASFILGSYFLSGCKSASNTAKGAGVGAAAGGAIGAAIGSASDNTGKGAIIGAAVGGVAGGLIGRRMDKQAEELQEDLEGAEVERVGEGILITFDSGLLFDVDSYQLRSATKRDLREMAETLKKYEDTNIIVEGHTDATGTNEYNMTLSRNRAGTVQKYLIDQGIRPARISAVGYGEERPVATNETAAGRQENRRVEVAIYANEEMKEAAKRGDL